MWRIFCSKGPDTKFRYWIWGVYWTSFRSRTTPLHPQSDRKVERYNRTLENHFRVVIDKNQTDWVCSMIPVGFQVYYINLMNYNTFNYHFWETVENITSEHFIWQTCKSPTLTWLFCYCFGNTFRENTFLGQKEIVNFQWQHESQIRHKNNHDLLEGGKIWLYNTKEV